MFLQLPNITLSIELAVRMNNNKSKKFSLDRGVGEETSSRCKVYKARGKKTFMLNVWFVINFPSSCIHRLRYAACLPGWLFSDQGRAAFSQILWWPLWRYYSLWFILHSWNLHPGGSSGSQGIQCLGIMSRIWGEGRYVVGTYGSRIISRS